jgi:hypothetical protein
MTGYNTFTIALPDVKGDEKETQHLGYNSANNSLEDINRENWSCRLNTGCNDDGHAL